MVAVRPLILITTRGRHLQHSKRKPSSRLMGNAKSMSMGPEASAVITKTVSNIPTPQMTETGIFAAGCFWGVELAYQRVPGVLETEVGYTDGHKENPTYQEVCRGTTGHTEALRVKFDPRVVKYNELLTVLWDRIDPTTLNRQGNDRGTQYRSGIYYTTPEQKDVAIASKEAEQKKHERPIVTEIKAATHFWQAEEYHQKYLEKGGQCSSKGDTTSIRCYG